MWPVGYPEAMAAVLVPGDDFCRWERLPLRRGEVMKTLMNRVQSFLVEEDGATATEYAVILALIIIVCIGAISALGTKVSSTFVDLETALP